MAFIIEKILQINKYKSTIFLSNIQSGMHFQIFMRFLR
jgi:hypothetical protein